VLNVGDMVMVKVIDVDRDGKIRLSRKALLPVPEGVTVPPEGDGYERRPRGDRDRGDRGGRDRDRGRGRR
jgi:polyribonucleotide nucleotidyltransferase